MVLDKHPLEVDTLEQCINVGLHQVLTFAVYKTNTELCREETSLETSQMHDIRGKTAQGTGSALDLKFH